LLNSIIVSSGVPPLPPIEEYVDETCSTSSEVAPVFHEILSLSHDSFLSFPKHDVSNNMLKTSTNTIFTFIV
jgi:hypothetical protein